MHKGMLYTWGEMITCIPELHGGPKAIKKRREWVREGGMDKEYIVVPMGTTIYSLIRL